MKWRDVSVLEACQYASPVTLPQSTSPIPQPTSPLTLTHAATTSARSPHQHSPHGGHSPGTNIMNAFDKGYMTSQRMLPGYSAVVPGLPSPSLPPAVTSHARGMPDHHSPKSPTSMAYDSFRDGRGGRGNVAATLASVYRGSHAETSAKAAAVASLAYARMQQDATGFPYGISGVAMPNYNYSSELYNYVSNGFPRKSRICSYCAKVFTRSTTRRYHEKRCPLLRAAGSLMKGSQEGNASANTSRASESGESSSHAPHPSHPSHPPPLLAMTRESPPSLLTIPTTSMTAATSLGQAASASNAQPNPLNSAQFYASYGSQSHALLTASVSTSRLLASPLDQNRNSVMAQVKQEADSAVDARADGRVDPTHSPSPASREADQLRNKLRSRDNGDSHGGQQQMFSPLSATSNSPSPGSGSVDEDADFDEAEDLTLRSAASVLKPALLTGGDIYTSGAPSFKPFYLTDFTRGQMAAQQVKYPIPGVAATDGVSPGRKTRCEEGQSILDASSDKDDSSYRDDDASMSYRDDDESVRLECAHSRIGDAIESAKLFDSRSCGVCSQEFGTASELRVHKLSHQKYKASACRFCGQRFLRTSMRMAHERLHSSDFPLGCVVCGRQFTRMFSLRQHVRRRHGKQSAKPDPCRHCGKQLESVAQLTFHVLTHRVLKSELMSVKLLHAPHPASHTPPSGEDEEGEEPSQERPPPPSIDSKTSQDSPVEIRSEPPPLIEARVLLGKTTPTTTDASSLVNGNSGGASGSRDMEWCRLCEKEYPKSFMRYHERAHADQKPYECPTCKKRFGYKNNMKSHMKLHAGIKPYQCQICGAKFTRGSTLRRHARRHGITTDTIWDLFVHKQGKQGGHADRAAMLNQHAAQVRDASMAALQNQSVAAQRQRSPPEVTGGTRAMKADPTLVASMAAAAAAADVSSPGGQKFDMRGYTQSPSLAQNLFASYPGLPAVTQAMYQPYMAAATSQFLAYPPSAGFSPTPVPAVQSDALNLSMPDRQRKYSSSSSTAGQARPSSAMSQGHTSHSMHGTQTTPSKPQIVVSNGDDEDTLDEMPPIPTRNDYTTERNHFVTNNGASASRMEVDTSCANTKPLSPARARDFGTQVTLCCAPLSPRPSGGSSEGGYSGSVDMSLSPNRSSPKLESLQHETLAALMSSGQLFRCPYCDCYFTEYAVFKIHQKYHDQERPFTCKACHEDCKDRVYFAVHMYEHHRR